MAVPLMRDGVAVGEWRLEPLTRTINNTTYKSNYAPYNNNGQPSKMRKLCKSHQNIKVRKQAANVSFLFQPIGIVLSSRPCAMRALKTSMVLQSIRHIETKLPTRSRRYMGCGYTGGEAARYALIPRFSVLPTF